MDCRNCHLLGKVNEARCYSQFSSWILEVICANCEPKRSWYVCKLCERKSQFTCSKQISQHHSRFHNNKKLKHCIPENNFQTYFETDFEEEKVSYGSFILDLSIFQREASKNFIKQELKGNGAGYLVGRSCCRLETQHDSLHPDDIKLHLRLAYFCQMISRNEREMFAAVLRSVMDFTYRKGSLNCGDHLKSYLPTEIPATVEKLRSTYAIGQHSLLNNLPCPLVREIHKHAYVSLREMIQHFLAIHTGESNKGVNFTKNFANICDRAEKTHPNASTYVVIEILEWSDDFDPNHLKNNRGSVWIKTITLRAMVVNVCEQSNHLTKERTFALALGPKGVSHEEVELELALELTSLCSSQSFYFFEMTKSMVPVYAELSVSLQDQPERRSSNCLLGGNSTMHGRWGYSADIVALSSVLPSCDRCFEILKKNEIDISTKSCIYCTNWSMDVDTSLLDFAAPADYPEEELSEGNVLRPKKLSYSVLISAVAKAREKLEKGYWSFSNAEAFLGLFCITKSTISDLLEASLYRRQLNEDDADALVTRNLLTEHPDYFVDKALPPLWTRKSELSNHVDVPMHLIFLGVVKATITMIKDWIKVRGHNQGYQKYANQALAGFPFVQWCVVNSFSGEKLGGWVSENYLAFSRLLKWFYCNCNDLFAEKDPYSDPPGDHKKWVKALCIKWLEARGVDLDMFINTNNDIPEILLDELNQVRSEQKNLKTAPVNVLRKMITYYKEMEGMMPELLSSRLCQVDDIVMLIKHLSQMVSAIMTCTGNEDTIREAEYEIKMFLSLVDRIDKSMKVTASNKRIRWKPKWISMYNFICLLNIPNIIRKYGPIRNIWEGAVQGEGYIRKIKPLLSSGLRKNWQVAKMKKLLQQDSLEMLMKSVDIENQITEERRNISSDFKLYSSILVAHQQYEKSEPLSGVQFGDNRFGLMLDENHFLEMKPDRSTLRKKKLCRYESWNLSLEAVCTEENIISYVLFLPLLENNEKQRTFFTVVYSNWNEH
jgi:hypothetical protein